MRWRDNEDVLDEILRRLMIFRPRKREGEANSWMARSFSLLLRLSRNRKVDESRMQPFHGTKPRS